MLAVQLLKLEAAPEAMALPASPARHQVVGG
jgi:hypothetical protein